MSVRLSVSFDFRGDLLPAAERAVCVLQRDARGLSVQVEAPLWGDPPPPGPPSRFAELWEYSVMELFILGSEGRYLELELSPFGHYWLLELATWRKRIRTDIECDYRVLTAEPQRARWRGVAQVGSRFLPAAPWRLSACTVWGVGSRRRYAMAYPTGGERPDFHQLGAFGEVLQG